MEDEEDGFPFDNDNTILFIDFKHEVNLNMSLFAELLVDDIQIDNTGLDHAFGYKIGMNKMFSFINKVFYTNFEWTEISPWAYIHNGQNTNWVNNSHPIGFLFGPDSKCAHLKLILEHSDKINLIFDLSFLNKGTNTIFRVDKRPD